MMPKISGYAKAFKVKDGDKGKDNKLISFTTVHDEKLLKRYKAICTKIEDLENIELNSFPVYEDRYIRTKIRAYINEVYTSFHRLNVPEHDVEC